MNVGGYVLISHNEYHILVNECLLTKMNVSGRYCLIFWRKSMLFLGNEQQKVY